MSSYEELYPSKYLKSSDVEDEPTVTISHISREEVGVKKETKPIIFFREYTQGMVLNKTNANTIAKIYGEDYDEWSGKKIVLFSALVDFQGDQVSSIRVKAVPRKPGAAQPQAHTKVGGYAEATGGRVRTDGPELNPGMAKRAVDERHPPDADLDDTIPF